MPEDAEHSQPHIQSQELTVPGHGDAELYQSSIDRGWGTEMDRATLHDTAGICLLCFKSPPGSVLGVGVVNSAQALLEQESDRG